MRRSTVIALCVGAVAGCPRASTTPALVSGYSAGSHGAPRSAPREEHEASTARVPVRETRLTYISVVRDGQRVIFTRRMDSPQGAPLNREPVFNYTQGRDGVLSVLTPRGVCQARAGRAFHAVQNCGRRAKEWTGFELDGCAFVEAGPLVAFVGDAPLRLQALSELSPAAGDEARAVRRRAQGHASRTGMIQANGEMREMAAMQREMEAMQAQQAALASGQPPPPPPPPPPPRAAVQLGELRSAFGVWLIDAVNSEGRTVMATASSGAASFRVHVGTRWHTLVAGPGDSDYVYLIGTSRYSWPVVVPARGGIWPRPRRYDSPPFGLIGPVMCADSSPPR